MRRRSALVALLAAGSLRCDWVMTVDADVRVEPATMASLQTYLQELLLGHEDPDRRDGSGAYRIGVLCAASDVAFTTQWHLSVVNGWGHEGHVTVWLSPVAWTQGQLRGAALDLGSPLAPRPGPGERGWCRCLAAPVAER